MRENKFINQPDSSSAQTTHQEDVQRLEKQIGQLIRIIANLNERLNYLETVKTNPFFLPTQPKQT
ncbi:hypothetical protein DV702_16430 [Sporosarcina sp. PTS2304]|uniref:hypothetical protein n=1 Tax=Sporosarcina sp. PTS2304 TaxID=2283194 RepID=UPI000E0DD666|nr:hypothetical protein [Sporosarcina sp. PTS2304]AXI01166.1 hypothetical protein DV702_16430 [Sporosarcina sp. PTS2304]